MNKYEIMIIVKAQLAADGREAVCKQVSDSIAKNGGKVVNSQLWLDKHRFASMIKKSSEGAYYLIKFENPSTSVDKIKQAARLNEDILRFAITKSES